MARLIFAVLVSALTLLAANFNLYLNDGAFHLVREYKIDGDRVRFYSVERSEWEEVPLKLVDLKRTETERRAREESVRKEAAEIAAEEKFEREQREERERVPEQPGVYLVEGKELKTVKVAESKSVTNKGRAILKVLSPIPAVTGKVSVELDGEHSAMLVAGNRPEFYIRLSREEHFGMVRLKPTKKGARVVQTWTIIPVSKEMIEEQDEVEIFRKQVDDGLYKIWPTAPLDPGEYAVVEFTPGKGNIQTWDFAWKPQ